jgi:hypothetical protein
MENKAEMFKIFFKIFDIIIHPIKIIFHICSYLDQTLLSTKGIMARIGNTQGIFFESVEATC